MYLGMSRFDQLVVNPRNFPSMFFDGFGRSNMFRHFFYCPRVVKKELEAGGELSWLPRRKDQTGLLMFHKFTHASQVRNYQRSPGILPVKNNQRRVLMP